MSVKVLRLLEWFLLLLFVVAVVALGYFYVTAELSPLEFWGIAAVGVLILLLQVTVQTTIDERVNDLLVQLKVAKSSVFGDLYEQSPVAYVTVDTRGRIVEHNPAAVHLLAVPSDQLLGENFFAFIPGDDAVAAAVLKGKVEAGVVLNDEEQQIICGNQQLKWVSLSVYMMGNSRERMIALLDITDQKMVDTAKSEFVALATHQLRTPIAAIRWNLELLEKKLHKTEAGAGEGQKYLDKIERNVLRMIALINDFLNVSKLEMGTFAASTEHIVLADFFNSIEDEFAEKITAKQLPFTQSVSPAGLVIDSDPRLLHIIVSNLVSNAVKYARMSDAVSATAVLQGTGLVIEVADSGIGIPEGELPKLFTKFFRASNAQSQQTEGTGLGLYVVLQSVEKLGGKIDVASVEGEGTRFVVSLPVEVVSG